MDYTGSFCYLDGMIVPAGGGEEIPPGEVSFYEVIRTRNGVPLFFDDHMNRLKVGIATRYDLDEDIASVVRHGLNALLSHERHDEINVKVTVSFTGHQYSLHICYIASVYPSETTVSEGVPLILYHAERLDPGVKMLNNRLRLSVDSELARRHAYEALLVNHDGYITEGSRSNIFFITDGGVIHTAPDSMVLAGITRRYVTEIIGKEGISLIHEAVPASEIHRFRSAFLTGTSPMVLAVKSIENQSFDVTDPLIIKLRRIYIGLADRSIIDYKMKNKAD